MKETSGERLLGSQASLSGASVSEAEFGSFCGLELHYAPVVSAIDALPML